MAWFDADAVTSTPSHSVSGSAKWLLPGARLLAMLVGVCLGTLPVLGQDIAGRLRGTVLEVSGSAVPGVKVHVENDATGTGQDTVSGKEGEYAFESLQPGTYTVTAEGSGFATFRSVGNVIEPRSAATLLIRLQVGSVNQQMEVSASAAQVDTTTPTLQTTLTNRQIEALPIIGRDARNTVETTQPGAVQAESGNNGPRTRVNGQRGATNNYQVDGTEAVEYLVGNSAPLPAPENLEEYSVITSSAGVELGTSAGSQVSAIIKSGTNSLHGSGWSYFRNGGLNANLWENKRNGGTPNRRPTVTQQWYGGNLGGPVWIPHIYDGRNRTFWFASYEYTHPALQVSQRLRVLSDAERSGNFSNSTFGIPVINGVKTPILNPANFSPMAKYLLSQPTLFPKANTADGFYQWYGTNSDVNKSTIVKLTHQFSDKHRIFGTWYRWTDSRLWDPLFGIQFGVPTLPNEGTSLYEQKISTYTFNDTYEISPNMVNNVVVGITHLNSGPTLGTPSPALSWDKLGVNQSRDVGVPASEVGIFVNGWGGSGFTIWGNYNNPNPSHQISVTENFTWVKSRHTVKAGYYNRVLRQASVGDFNGGGNYNFSAGQPNSTGNVFADFALGQGATFSQNALAGFHYHYPAREAYLQDQFRLNSRITLDLGVRWAPFFGISEDSGATTAFRPGRQSTQFPNAPVGLLVPGDAGISKAGIDTRYTNLAPRFGLAVDLTGKGTLVFRGGYGINYDYQNFSDYGHQSAPYGFSFATPAGQSASITDPYGGPSPFPYTQPAPGSPQAKKYVFQGKPVVYSFREDFNTGRIYQWNATIEWQPFQSYVLRASYLGTRGTHLVSTGDANAPIFIPNASTNANAESRRPLQNFQGVFLTTSSATSKYESMQLVLQKQFARGFSINANYTLSQAHDSGDSTGHSFGSGSNRDPYNPNLDYGISNFDVTHNFNLIYVYAPEYFKHSANVVTREVLGGWTFSGISQARSGQALLITSPAGFNVASSNFAYANYNGGNRYGAGQIRTNLNARWLNQAAYCPANATGPTCTVDPTAGVTHLALGNYERGSARGPGAFLNSMSLDKSLLISERFGAISGTVTATNVFNHTILNNPDTNIGDGSNFGNITNAQAPRNLQLALHYTF